MTYKVLLINADHSCDYDNACAESDVLVREISTTEDIVNILLKDCTFVHWLRDTKNESFLKILGQAGFCKISDIKKIDKSIKFCDGLYMFRQENQYQPPVLTKNIDEYAAKTLVKDDINIYYKVKPESVLTGKALKSYKDAKKEKKQEEAKKKVKKEKKRLSAIEKARKVLKNAGELK